MERAKLICHMATTIDGETNWYFDTSENENFAKSVEIYDSMIDGYSRVMCNGRATLQGFVKNDADISEYKGIPVKYEDKVIDEGGSIWASVDRFGKLRYDSKYRRYAGHDWLVLEVLTKKVPPEFIAYLNTMNIPYIFCGEEDFDPELFLRKIKKYYKTDTVTLSGGAELNAAFMRKDMIDEISMIIGPAVDGRRKNLTFIGSDNHRTFPKYFKLAEVKDMGNSTVFLRYTRE